MNPWITLTHTDGRTVYVRAGHIVTITATASATELTQVSGDTIVVREKPDQVMAAVDQAENPPVPQSGRGYENAPEIHLIEDHTDDPLPEETPVPKAESSVMPIPTESAAEPPAEHTEHEHEE